MKVGEFVKKYVRLSYSADAHFLKQYDDVEIMCGIATGAEHRYVTAFIFKSARKHVAYVNGYRSPLNEALNIIENVTTYKETTRLEEAARVALMESL